jgi:hypothetical protein
MAPGLPLAQANLVHRGAREGNYVEGIERDLGLGQPGPDRAGVGL